MRYFDEYLGRQDVQAVIARCQENPAVQGVIVDLDPAWLLCRRYAEAYYGSRPPRPDDFFRLFRDGFEVWHVSQPAAETRMPLSNLTAGDLTWGVEQWNRSRMRQGLPEVVDGPIRLRVCVHPGAGADLRFDENNLHIVLEARARPSLAATPTTVLSPLIGGGSVGASHKGAGTLGGLLEDKHAKKYYGVTCAHVAVTPDVVDHPSRRDSTAGSRIGGVAHDCMPNTFPTGLALTTANQALHANEVDAALIEIDAAVAAKLEIDSLGPIAGVFKGSIQQWQPATYVGRTSNRQNVEFRGCIVYYNVPDGKGGTVCFQNLYEIQWPPSGHRATSPIQAGDSGAWLCVSTPKGYEWAALAVASDPTMGFAVRASKVEDWWKAQGFTLTTC